MNADSAISYLPICHSAAILHKPNVPLMPVCGGFFNFYITIGSRLLKKQSESKNH